jgi:serine/threonine protein phosphatase PrpC
MEITHRNEIGSRRYQEDQGVIARLSIGTLLAVCDGHGGQRAADIAAGILPELFKANYGGDAKETFRKVISSLNETLLFEGSGTTLSAVFIPADGDRVTVAILGDSPVIVWHGTEIWYSPEHNVRSNPSEAGVMAARGITVFNGYIMNQRGHGLQLTRALGDADFSEELSRTPEIFEFTMQPHNFILLASDGVLDPTHETAAHKRITDRIQAGATAEDVVQDALDADTGDNATAILVRF